MGLWVGGVEHDMGLTLVFLRAMDDIWAVARADPLLKAKFDPLYRLPDLMDTEQDVPTAVFAHVQGLARDFLSSQGSKLGADGKWLLQQIGRVPVPVKAGPALIHKAQHLDAYWDRVRASILDPWEAEYAKRYVTLVRSLKRDAVAKAHAGSRSPVDLAAWRDAFRAGLGRVYKSAFLIARRQMVEDTLAPSLSKAARRSPVQAEARVLGALTDRIDYMLDTITEALDDRITTLYEDSENEDVTKDDVAAAVEEFFGQYLRGGKIQSIARTETSATVNAGRAFEMEARGVQQNAWVTAMDERVRETHVIYGAAGPMPTGFNWATLVGERYMLRRPYDPRCVELSEIVNCRCFLMPADAQDIDVAHKLWDRWVAA